MSRVLSDSVKVWIAASKLNILDNKETEWWTFLNLTKQFCECPSSAED